ncbi:hypothetical protein ACIP9X_14020 [Arthrobacter sp. NPDC093125]|uniref:hypothetical protein n=1 Tax=Arthrobacter sp. NPDC093125 TaxID=3363944 RepID=UPI003804AC99
MIEITRLIAPDSPTGTAPSTRPALRTGVIQHRWQSNAAAARAELNDGIEHAAPLGELAPLVEVNA